MLKLYYVLWMDKKELCPDTNLFYFFILISLLLPGKGLQDNLLPVLSITSFIFGFYIAYAISRAKERHKSVLDQLRTADGLFINSKIQMEVFDKKLQRDFIKKIDDYLTTSIDYKLIDSEMASPEFFEIIDFVTKIKPKNDLQSAARSNVISSLESLAEKRTLLEIAGKDRISKLEWIIIGALFLLLLYFLFSMDISGIKGDIIKSILATTLTMLIVLLAKINNLSWKENRWIWEPLGRTFRALGLLPYYGDFMFTERKAKRPKDGEYRVVHYPYPYPNFKGKVVKIVKS